MKCLPECASESLYPLRVFGESLSGNTHEHVKLIVGNKPYSLIVEDLPDQRLKAQSH